MGTVEAIQKVLADDASSFLKNPAFVKLRDFYL